MKGVYVEAAPERRHLRGQCLLANRDRFPIESVAGQRKHVAFLGADKKQHQRLICVQQRLNLLGRQRQRVRQRRVVGKLLGKGLLQAVALGSDNRKPVPDPLLGSTVTLGGLLGNRRDDFLVEGFRFRREVLILADKLRQPV